ncbi:hypothetical protein JOB18_044256 [Solea senegalensis]|uniref:Uncharacterized protein n=1 Tax=Solea senegalensis TaxID=28829 RepID=A0AAV6QX07_SOLSE|nr:hypothetical protein JOB18_044256 [Solea senegalensis]
MTFRTFSFAANKRPRACRNIPNTPDRSNWQLHRVHVRPGSRCDPGAAAPVWTVCLTPGTREHCQQPHLSTRCHTTGQLGSISLLPVQVNNIAEAAAPAAAEDRVLIVNADHEKSRVKSLTRCAVT